MPIYALDGLTPVVDPTAFVHPTAVLIGDAVVGPNCYVGPGASMRGDFGRVQLEAGANLQDNCVMHSFPGRIALVEVNGHIGHGAILHGCTVGRDALVGMQAVIMDDAVIGEGAFVAAMSFVKSKERVPPRVLVAGIPARVLRELSEQEITWKRKGTEEYQELARRCLTSLRECAPLRAIEPDRPQNVSDVRPLGEYRTKS
jgi:phenylacetic acid degradation protein